MSPAASNDDGFPQFPRSERGPPSIISSRMTDIMTEDGGDSDAQRGGSGSQRKSALYSEGTSRPGTSRTAMSQRAPWGQGTSLRRGLSGKRLSVGGGSVAGAARPVSSMSRSHVPTLTSHAFFRPMSSQKLQAQRGIARPSTMRSQVAPSDVAGETNRDSLVSNQGAAVVGIVPSGDEGETRPPPSRGTEFTEQEAYDRITANTSPTHGYHPTSSVTDSVRPLHRKPEAARNLTLDINKTYKTSTNTPTPVRTPHSMRSSFLMQRMESSNGNREMEGGEKLDSLASSPQLPPSTTDRIPPPKEEKKKPAMGRNYEYFLGNTVFCLGGRLQNTRHRPVNIATGSFIVIPGALFFGFSAPWIWNNLSPAIPITFAYVFFICMSSFIHASVTDPGVCPYPNITLPTAQTGANDSPDLTS